VAEDELIARSDSVCQLNTPLASRQSCDK